MGWADYIREPAAVADLIYFYELRCSTRPGLYG
jgi:hypothetical protein